MYLAHGTHELLCARSGRAMKRLPRPPSELPYVVDRLKRNVELDRRFYIKVAERGLSEFIIISFVFYFEC